MSAGCTCINVKMGSYDNQVTLPAPSWSSRDVICVDKCLSEEIISLWDKGIITSGCCCGHGDSRLAYIGVYPESIDRMIELGYKNYVKINCGNDLSRDHFIPKTIRLTKENR